MTWSEEFSNVALPLDALSTASALEHFHDSAAWSMRGTCVQRLLRELETSNGRK